MQTPGALPFPKTASRAPGACQHAACRRPSPVNFASRSSSVSHLRQLATDWPCRMKYTRFSCRFSCADDAILTWPGLAGPGRAAINYIRNGADDGVDKKRAYAKLPWNHLNLEHEAIQMLAAGNAAGSERAIGEIERQST